MTHTFGANVEIIQWVLAVGLLLFVGIAITPVISVCVDHDGDGMIEVMDEGDLKQLRTSVTIYTIPKEGEQAIRLWD